VIDLGQPHPSVPGLPLRPDGSDCRQAMLDAIRLATEAGAWVVCDSLEPGEYVIDSVADAYPALGLQSGAKILGKAGAVFVDGDRNGKECVGVMGVYLASTDTISRSGIELVGVEARHRGALSDPGDVHHGFTWRSERPGTATVEFRMLDCISHGSPGDGCYIGSGAFGTVERWRADGAGRHGICVAGYATSSRGGTVIRGVRGEDKPGSGDAVHVEIEASATTLPQQAGIVVEDLDAVGGCTFNRAEAPVLRRATLRDEPGRGGGGLTLTHSPDALVEGLTVRFSRPPPNPTTGKLSDERAIRVRGDCSRLKVKGGVIVNEAVAAPNATPPAIYVAPEGSTGIELDLQVWHPAGTLALSAPAGAVAVADLDDRVIA
jgi:hypothetical protein